MSVRERVEQIYVAERESIYSYLIHFGVAPQRAQELVQDCFLKLYVKMERGETVENPRAWLYRVAHNFALRHSQRERWFDVLDPEFESPHAGPNPESAVMEKQRREALYRAIGGLSAQQRNCLHLRVEGLRYREIAEVIGISTSAVGEFLRRAVTRLKEVMDA